MRITAKPNVSGQRSAFTTDLPRLAGVIERQAGRMEPFSRILEHAQPFVLGNSRIDGAEHADRVALLEAVEGARCGAGFDVRECGYRYELAAGRLDLEIQ